jgi:hypothetical protein
MRTAKLSVWENRNAPNYHLTTKHYNINKKVKKKKTPKINTKGIKKNERRKGQRKELAISNRKCERK